MFKFLKGLAERAALAATPAAIDDDPIAIRRSATQALGEGRLADAAHWYQRLAERDPTDAEVFTAWGFVLKEAGRNAEAQSILASAARLAPHSADPLYLLGELMQAAGQPAQAISHYRSALQVQPGFAPACAPLCKLLYEQGDLAGAAAVMRSAIEFHPDRADFHLFAGNIALSRQEPAQAVQAFERALALQPEMPTARSNLVVALEAAGETLRALDMTRAMLAAEPARQELRVGVGRLAFEQRLAGLARAEPVRADGVAGPVPDPGDVRPMKLVVEGWRGINHSFALIHQFQILELLRRRDVVLSCRDLPFGLRHWNSRSVSAGFDPVKQAKIDAVPVVPEGAAADSVYRISAPFAAPQPHDSRRTFTYMVTEYGLTRANFADGRMDIRRFTAGGNRVVTSSLWSRQRLVDEGLDADDIDIVTCGVDREVFAPPEPLQRAAWRRQLGLQEHETVFLNLGAAFWNKGVDLLMLAFATLRQRRRDIRLILKDQRALYGVASAETTLRDLSNRHPALFPADTIDAITLVGSTLTQARLAGLYGVADGYVSPYRAEGFNLPVLEALACAVPVIVTDGGSTDDFCPPTVATRLPSRMLSRDSDEPGRRAHYLEPDFDALVDAMSRLAAGDAIDRGSFRQHLDRLLPTKSWTAATSQLVDAMRRP
jgi:glycosyltransferase involved in cell wall biosynthesis/Flp pilus assembly protein TadD